MVDYEDIEKELTELSLTRQTATDEQMKTAMATAQDKLLGVAYLMCSDKHRFGKIVEDIDNGDGTTTSTTRTYLSKGLQTRIVSTLGLTYNF